MFATFLHYFCNIGCIFATFLQYVGNIGCICATLLQQFCNIFAIFLQHFCNIFAISEARGASAEYRSVAAYRSVAEAGMTK